MVILNQTPHPLTLEAFLKLPETKPYSEYFNEGDIRQKPMPQGEHSIIQTRLVKVINELILPDQLGHAFTELRCTFGCKSIVPDISVFQWQRIPRTEKGRIVNRFMISPDWVIQILSPEQSTNQLMKKIIFCLKQGTQLGWLIDPNDESIIIFKPDQLPEIQSANDILPVLNLFTQWELSVNKIFNWLKL